MLIFNWILTVIFALFLEFWNLAYMSVLMEPMVLSVVYVWCQINKDYIINFWFGTQFKAMYLPWVLFAFSLIIKFDGMGEICGILIGHIYFFLMFKYPQDFGGPSLLSTPDILYSWFPNKWGRGVPGYGQAPQQGGGGGDGGRGGGGAPRHAWGGRGHRLGNN